MAGWDNVEQLDLGALTSVRCSFSRYVFADRRDVLVMSFDGEYGAGSEGNPDARAMTAHARAALHAWDCDALVFDFRQLSYQWGDAILQLLDLDSTEALTPLPRTFVGGDNSRGGMTSLLAGATLYSELEPAVEEAHQRAVVLLAEEEAAELELKMYVLVRKSIPVGFGVLAAAHGSLAAYEHFNRRWETRAWISGVFHKVVCQVTDEEFAKAKTFEDYVVITESALDGQEVALAFRPRVEWPRAFKFFQLYGK